MALVKAQAERPDDDEEDEDAEMELGDKEFIISELLKLTVSLDYSDEIGRRKTFALIRMYLFSIRVRMTDDLRRRNGFSRAAPRRIGDQMS